MSIFVAVLGVLLALGTVGYFLFGTRHPQNASSHSADKDVSPSRQFYGDKNDRPGGPGSEADGVVDPGVIAPGPSADAGGTEPAWGRPPKES
ncbi:MAG: hypothetical protein JWN99_3410 [Ilumatobacteraceae bacterium]|nr:hypothetical protein [Ilumatobacteraceae bacterium]